MATHTTNRESECAESGVKPLDITVLAGGISSERDVSLEGGKAVGAALRSLGHRVFLSDIEPQDLSALDRPADFVFIVLHGEYGEDGALQAELDRRGLPYSGCGAEASRLAMDKVQAKVCFEKAGIDTPPYVLVSPDKVRGLASRFATPAVVKPVSAGSSVDTSIVHKGYSLEKAAASVSERYGAALVERYIDGPELTVGILNDEPLPVCEIRTERDFYDYQAKYVDDGTEYLLDLDFPTDFLAEVQRLSVQAHSCLGCQVFSRVDWRIDKETMKPYVLEVNTIPGFTSHSLLPKAALHAGIDFATLCQRIVELSLRRNRRQGVLRRQERVA